MDNIHVGNLTVRGNSIIESTNSVVGTLIPDISNGETGVIGGNITINKSMSITSGSLVREFPIYIRNRNDVPLSNVSVVLTTNSLTSGIGYTTVSANFTPSTTELPLYTDGLNIKNVSMIDDTPLNLTNWWLDPDDDGTSILNDPDDDNDGIIDVEDQLTGNISWVQTNTQDLNISVNGSYNLSQKFNGSLPVVISDHDGLITTFNWNFTKKKLELQYLNITKGSTADDREYVIISGLNIPEGSKTVYLNRTKDSNVVCIIDEDHLTVAQVTENTQCLGGTVLTCPGSEGQYSCSLTNGNETFNITGLQHTGVIQLNNIPTTTTTTTTVLPSGGSSSGRSSGGGSSPQTFVNMTNKYVKISNIFILAGSSKTIDLSEWSGPVHKFVIHATQPIYGGYVEITKLSPDEIWGIPKIDGNVYQYFKIDTDISGKGAVDVYFHVDKSWIIENSINDVYLWRYETKWQKISTEEIGETDDYVNYISSLSKLSYFAIVGEGIEVPTPEETSTTVYESVCGNGVCEEGETESSCPEDCKTEENHGMLYLIGSIVFFIIVMFIVVRKKLSSGGATKVQKSVPQLKPPVKISEILTNPVNYIGKEVDVEGDVKFVEFSPEENKVLYKISDDTGTIEGFSRKTSYHGHNRIHGVIKRKDDKIYLYF